MWDILIKINEWFIYHNFNIEGNINIMLNINNLNNGNLDNIKSDNVVKLNNSDKSVSTNQDKIDYAFNMLKNSGSNPSDYM